ncbi:MAG TPA: hypothetical protein VMD78_05795 [Candidatus Baltobacteraceae bacterium]|nr:hypothetical protein [Candidatus Baltobacteraceae bacterium]
MSPQRSFLLVTVLLALAGVSARAQGKPGGDFPLAQGTYWVYRGFVRWTVANSSTVKLTRVTWKTEVTRTIYRDGMTIAVVRGMPGDLDWSDGNPTPSLSIVIRTRDAKFYLVEDDEAKTLIGELDHPQFSWGQVPVDHDWFLQLPLAKGKKFCEAEGMQRTDNHYCWVTGAPHAAELANVKGIPQGKRAAYRVEYFTNPDDDEFDFVPGIGMVTYGYHHHGTVADTELHLIEFHDGADKIPGK